MLNYFPESYWLSINVSNALGCGASIGDVVLSCAEARKLTDVGVAESDPRVVEAWINGWSATASQLRDRGMKALEEGRVSTGEALLLRATTHYMIAEWLTPFGHERKLPIFTAMRASLDAAVAVNEHGSEFVRIPYQGQVLDGLFVPAESIEGPSPVLIHFNGSHSSIEWPYLSGLARRLAHRGIASLMFDHPGSGSARYLYGLTLRPDTEVPAAAAIEWLKTRATIDPDRIGTIGGSLGGYHAPRVAARDPRIAACLCWGALYELPAWLIDYASNPKVDPGAPIRDPHMAEGLSKMFGASVGAALATEMRRYSMSGVIGGLSCPFYVIHGASDPQVPVESARRLVAEATGTKRKALYVCGPELGEQHCNMDNLAPALDLLADLAAEALLGSPGD